MNSVLRTCAANQEHVSILSLQLGSGLAQIFYLLAILFCYYLIGIILKISTYYSPIILL